MRAVAYEPITGQLGRANGKKENGKAAGAGAGAGERGQSYEQFHP